MSKAVSLKRRTLKRFLIITVVVGIIFSLTMQAFLHIYVDHTFQQNADSYATFIKDKIIGDVNVKELSPDKPDEDYNRIHDELEELCVVFNIKYIFIYTLTDDGMIMRNLIAAASEEDKAVIEENNLLGNTFEPTERGEAIIVGGKKQTSWEERNKFGNVRSYMYGLYDDTGKLIGFACMDVPESKIQKTMRLGMTVIVFVIAFVLLLMFALLYWSINKNVYKPLQSIASSMSNYIDDYRLDNTEIHLPPSREMQSIVSSFDKMSGDIKRYVANIEMLTEERAKSEAGMEAARRIQAGFVPDVSERRFASAGIYAVEKPSRAVGGDFYDCFEANGMLYGVVGDVSEKGISAALFMAVLKSKLFDSLRSGNSPAEALLAVNDDLCDQNPEGMFATIFIFMLELNSGIMTFANAGHNKPVVLNDEARFLDMDSGMLIGLLKGISIKNETLKLTSGDAVVIYTDGVTEAVNKDREFYGEDRLLSLLSGAESTDANTLTLAVRDSVDSFQTGCEQFDDITVFSLKYYGNADLKLPCSISAIKDVRAAVFERIGTNEAARKILLACEEIFTNICSYFFTNFQISFRIFFFINNLLFFF